MQRFAAAALALLMLCLAGCGGNPDPKPLPKTDSTSPSASPSPPSMPAKAKLNSNQGAVAFLAHFLATMNFAGKVGRTEEFRALYTTRCVKCARIADGIDNTYKQGGKIEGGEWTIASTKIYGRDKGLLYVDLTVDFASQTLLPKVGATPSRYPQSASHLEPFVLRWSHGSWQVDQLNPDA